MAKKINTREVIRKEYADSKCCPKVKENLAEKYGLTPMTVKTYLSGILSEMDMMSRPKRTTAQTQQIILDLQDGTLSQSQIAKKYALSRQRIHSIHKKFVASCIELQSECAMA